jgi:hypothetical protein
MLQKEMIPENAILQSIVKHQMESDLKNYLESIDVLKYHFRSEIEYGNYLILKILEAFIDLDEHLSNGRLAKGYMLIRSANSNMEVFRKNHFNELGYKTLFHIVGAWMKYYPRPLAFSMALSEELECSICGEDTRKCPHIKALLYDGRVCIHVVKKIKRLQSISITRYPRISESHITMAQEGDKKYPLADGCFPDAMEVEFFKQILLNIENLVCLPDLTVTKVRKYKPQEQCFCNSGKTMKTCHGKYIDKWGNRTFVISNEHHPLLEGLPLSFVLEEIKYMTECDDAGIEYDEDKFIEVANKSGVLTSDTIKILQQSAFH